VNSHAGRLRALNEIVEQESAFVDDLHVRGQEGDRRAGRDGGAAAVGLLTGGHVLIEGVARGLAKTLAVPPSCVRI
jgi:MoxR-like ATPase